MDKVSSQERQWIKEYFAISGWDLSDNLEIVSFGTIEEVLQYLGRDIENKTYEEMESMVDEYRNIWFDGEVNHVYYLIVP